LTATTSRIYPSNNQSVKEKERIRATRFKRRKRKERRSTSPTLHMHIFQVSFIKQTKRKQENKARLAFPTSLILSILLHQQLFHVSMPLAPLSLPPKTYNL